MARLRKSSIRAVSGEAGRWINVGGASSRDKGSRWERDVAKCLGKWWGATFRRTPMSGGWHLGDGEGKGKLRGDLVQMDGPEFPFSVECKATESWSLDRFLKEPDRSCLSSYLRQAWTGAADEGKIPMLVAKRNLQPAVVFIPAEIASPCECRMIIGFEVGGVIAYAAVVMLATLTEVEPSKFMPRKKRKGRNK